MEKNMLSTTLQRRAQRAFTLVELMIVIAIIVLLAGIVSVSVYSLWGDAETSTTNTSLQVIGQGVQDLESQGKLVFLLKPKLLKEQVKPAFSHALGFDGGYDDMSPIQRSKLLVFLIAPRKDQWDQVRASSRNAYKPLIDEAVAGGLITRDSKDNYDYFTDAWDNPISFEVNFEGSVGVAAQSPQWVIVSPGPDGSIEEDEDNLNWSEADGKYEGPWKR